MELQIGTKQYINGLDMTVTVTQEIIDTEKAIKEEMRIYYLSCREQKTVTEVLEVSHARMTVTCSDEIYNRACHIAKRKGMKKPERRTK